jgi:anti-sigma factor RsiW
VTEAYEQGHGDWDALAVAWALSALDPEDEARFADHLPGCPRCTSTVRESLHTVAALAYALPEETPPRRLRRRLMDSVAAEPRRAPARPPAEDLPADLPADPHVDLPASAYLEAPDHPYADMPDRQYGEAADGLYAAGREPAEPRPAEPVGGRGVDGFAGGRGVDAPGPYAGDGVVVPLESRRRGWVRRAAVAAAVALIAALGAWNVKLHSDQDQLRDVVAQRDALVARLTEPGPAEVAVIRQGRTGTGERQATVVVKDGRVGLITETLDPQPTGRAYWLWSLAGPGDAHPVPLANFPVPETRLSACNIEPPAGVDVTRAFAISEEPATARPTTPTEVVAYGSTDQQ